MPGAVVSALGRWFFAPAPPERLALCRILVCGYASLWTVVRAAHWVDLAQLEVTRYRPVGLLSLAGGPLGPATVVALAALTATAGVAATAGWWWRASGPVLAGGFLVLATHGASWGQILHTEHLPALHLAVLAATPAADAMVARRPRCPTGRPRPSTSPQAGRRPTVPVGPASERYGWGLRVLAMVTAGTYVVAGVAKLRYGGTGWVSGEVLRNLVAHDNVRKHLLGDVSSPLARHVVRYPALFAPAAVATVVVELGAPLALIGGRLRTAWVATAWAFHAGVLAFMAVLFPYPLLGVAFAPLFAVERLVAPAHRWVRAGRLAPLSVR